MDSNGDGIGDFRGLTHRLDHLERLGVTAVWLNPFYPTPNRDNGYDVTDFYGIDPRLGNPGDFVAFSRAARDRGMRGDRRPRRQPHLDRPPVVPVRPVLEGQPLSRLVRLVRGQARGHHQGHHLPRRAGGGLDLRRGRGGLVHAPLLRPSGRPQHLQPRCPRRDHAGHGLLARDRRLGLPHRRGAVSDRIQGVAARPRARPEAVPLRDARLSQLAPVRGDHAGRGQCAARDRARLLRRARVRDRRADAHAVRLSAQSVPLAGPRARLGNAADRRAAKPARRGAGARAMGDVPAQPRRIVARQADR